MANKMNKIKSALKKWQSFGRMGRSYSSLSSNPIYDNNYMDEASMSDSADCRPSSLVHADVRDAEAPKGCKVVYVGKSKRRYFISACYLNHPLLRALVERCEGDNEVESFAVSCEVVLFEHLVWMLENADPETIQSYSLEELVEFYACS